jgi:hypothetical protein
VEIKMNKRTLDLINLIKENPDLEVVPMVNTDCVQDDCCAYWFSKFGCAKVDEYCCSDERAYLKSDDYEDLIDKYMDEYPLDYQTNDEEIEKWAIEKVNNLPWKKAILLYIECA